MAESAASGAKAEALAALLTPYPQASRVALRQLCLDLGELKAQEAALERRGNGAGEPGLLRACRDEIHEICERISRLAGAADSRALIKEATALGLSMAISEEEAERIIAHRRPRGTVLGAVATTTAEGKTATWNKHEDPEEQMSYYQRVQAKYGRGRRGSSAVAGGDYWDQVLLDSEETSPVIQGLPEAPAPRAASHDHVPSHAMSAASSVSGDPDDMQFQLQRLLKALPVTVARAVVVACDELLQAETSLMLMASKESSLALAAKKHMAETRAHIRALCGDELCRDVFELVDRTAKSVPQEAPVRDLKKVAQRAINRVLSVGRMQRLVNDAELEGLSYYERQRRLYGGATGIVGENAVASAWDTVFGVSKSAKKGNSAAPAPAPVPAPSPGPAPAAPAPVPVPAPAPASARSSMAKPPQSLVQSVVSVQSSEELSPGASTLRLEELAESATLWDQISGGATPTTPSQYPSFRAGPFSPRAGDPLGARLQVAMIEARNGRSDQLCELTMSLFLQVSSKAAAAAAAAAAKSPAQSVGKSSRGLVSSSVLVSQPSSPEGSRAASPASRAGSPAASRAGSPAASRAVSPAASRAVSPAGPRVAAQAPGRSVSPSGPVSAGRSSSPPANRSPSSPAAAGGGGRIPSAALIGRGRSPTSNYRPELTSGRRWA